VALSMRRVAADLGVATMSLYRHVSGKDDLVAMMVDAAFGEAPLPSSPPPGWRARLELSARSQWALYRRHPWLAQAISMTRPQLIPNGMAHTEWALQALDGLGLDATTMFHVHLAIFSYVRGIAVNFELEAQAEQDTGITDEQWIEAQEPTLSALMTSGPFPVLSRLAAEPDFDLDLDLLFETGLRHLLDGLAVRLASPRP